MAREFHQASGRRLQEWEFHHTELRLEYGGGALVFVDRDQWDEVQFVSSGRVSLCEISSASPALVSVHCYPRSSSFHFLNSVSKNVAFLFMLIHESFPKNRREKRWVPFSIACTKGFLFAIGVHDAVELTEQFRGPRFRVHSLGFWRLP